MGMESGLRKKENYTIIKNAQRTNRIDKWSSENSCEIIVGICIKIPGGNSNIETEMIFG